MLAARVLAAFAAAAVLSACSASDADQPQMPAPSTVSWAMYQHSPDRNAVFTNYAIPRDWAYDAKAQINGGLALAGNTLLFTTFGHKLVALDVRSGRQLWQAPVGNIAMSTPIVAGNTVYVGTGRNGVLERNWNIPLKLEFGNRVLWGSKGGDEVSAFDLKTGARKWEHRTVGENMPSAVYQNGRLIFANGDWRAYALRADTGRQLWATDIGGVSTMANAVLAGGDVVVSVCTDGMRKSSAVALDPASGKILWRSPYGHCDASPAYGAGKVFTSTVSPGDTMLQGKTVVAALDARTGKAVWVYRSSKQGLWSTVGSSEAAVAGTYANGMYYQSAPFDDRLMAFDANTGRIKWNFQTSGPVKMSPVVANRRVYVGDTAGLLYTLDARTGVLLELREFNKPFATSPPIVAGNKILIVNGTTVAAIPVSGKPATPKGVGWAVVPAQPQMQTMR